MPSGMKNHPCSGSCRTSESEQGWWNLPSDVWRRSRLCLLGFGAGNSNLMSTGIWFHVGGVDEFSSPFRMPVTLARQGTGSLRKQDMISQERAFEPRETP